MPAETSLAICSLIFGGVLERLPRLRVCFRPRRRGVPRHAGPHRSRLPGAGPTCAPSTTRTARAAISAAFYVDSLVHDADALRTLLHLLGDRRIILGSDYPFPLGEDVPGTLVELMTT